jgi:cell division protein FtsI/penicillin-binding protein 2
MIVGLASPALLVWWLLPPSSGIADVAERSPSQQVAAEVAADPLAPAEVLTRIPLTQFRVNELLAAPAGSDHDPNLAEVLAPPDSRPDLGGPLRIDYTLNRDLSLGAHKILRQGRVELGHVIVMDPASGRILAYASTDPERFPADRTYPAASLVKVVTAAAALHHIPGIAEESCRYVGNPYRLTAARVDPPRSGHEVSLRRALATSNNQCFAQLAVHRVGQENLLGAIDRFGWLSAPAPHHPPGEAVSGVDAFALGKLGAGLDGSRITPLHAAQLASTLADGLRIEPYWIQRVSDGSGRELHVPRGISRRVLTPELAGSLREMLVDTTERGTARRAFRTRRGPILGSVRVAGKTGSLSGKDPDGRYEWFVGIAPADAPTLAVAVVLVQGDLYWATPAQVAAEMLKVAFCPKGVCQADAALRWLEPPRVAGLTTPSVSAPSAGF